MVVELVYLADCPHWQQAERRLHRALELVGRTDVEVVHHRITTPAADSEGRFPGSPTILVDGVDAFPDEGEPHRGTSCRLYLTPEGLQGSPTVAQLRAALA